MKYLKKILVCLMATLVCVSTNGGIVQASAEDDYIKWVDCNVSADILRKVSALDIKYHATCVDFNFCEVLAYLALKNGNKFSAASDNKNLDELTLKLEQGNKLSNMYGDNKYYKYYVQCYDAIFGQFIGEYVDGNGEDKYGLTAYFPFPKNWWYTHYDDFGSSRSYGYKRKHLGHDLMGSVGTPIIATESGTITELGWNRFGGWRIGIRSFDTKRYYYYAHLRKDRPYAKDLEVGTTIRGGEVIGYLGRTGYSTKENVNLKTGKPHLHMGMQIIFHPDQETGNKEIWIDLYQITNFLAANRVAVTKDDTNEYHSTI